ncbi:MAG: HDOD domain-containing protein [Spirochaetales bacterium]|jgi:putative nucleotidyltransferase with HDIG domain|nr:HDOD domain-containing protein [Spirochaetales bacterium]
MSADENMNADENLKKVSAYISKLPALPVTVSKILEIANNPNTSPVDLNRVISLDPVLMARVMKLINSAYYGVTNQVTSLVRAIIMLGINTVKNLALSTAVLGNLSRKENFQALNMNGFWRHSLSVGVLSKLIARSRNVDPKILEEYFIAGLLHDIGKIPLNNTLTTEFVQAMSRADTERMPLFQLEEECIGFDHSRAGFIIGSEWKFGAEILETIKSHHSLESCAQEHSELVYTVAAANCYVDISGIGFSGSRYPEKLPQNILDHLGISWDNLESMHGELVQEIEKAKIFLKAGED